MSGNMVEKQEADG